ncbi:MAG: 1-deoxy-D-xylulose-5-phosphate reductoisomerase, partial [Lachnospiraceae bacterium]|nr:1-deoxy-D-xylulose-5-phosphate reductoisomerase [Lachnospiraceae bacterium]
MAEKIILLGSTGSIGTQTLEVVRQHRDRLSVSALIANRSVEAVEAQAREFCVPCCAMFQEEAAKELRSRLKDTKTKVLSGMEGILEIMEQSDADTVLSAVVGMIGILPTIRAIEFGKDIALANKETLVCAGHLIMPLARQKKVRILPVDSEHSAIFQSLNGEQKGRIEKILLTASGGPFRGKTKKELEQVTVKEALQHPNWSMGAKITVDSASLINKGLEVIEAVHLFDVRPDQIQVVVQPQSVLHS